MLALTAQWTLHSENQGRSVIRRSTRRFMREGEARRTLIFPLPFPPSLRPYRQSNPLVLFTGLRCLSGLKSDGPFVQH